MRADQWALDPQITFLNHGSFGARPREVVDYQQSVKTRFETNPVAFVDTVLGSELEKVRRRLSAFLDLDEKGLVFVDNATTGVNTALRAVELRSGDEMVVTDHVYSACRNAVEAVAGANDATVIVVELPLPVDDVERLTEAVLERLTSRTRVVLIDHVTSPTAIVMPVQEIVDGCGTEVAVIVDAAHSPGMVDCRIEGAAFITGNCHKWLSAPSGSAFLWVRPDFRGRVDPLVISHGWNSRADQERLRTMFDWVGTKDWSAVLSVASAIDSVQGMAAGGWDEIRRSNHELAVASRDLLLDVVGGEPLTPVSSLGSMASIRLSDSPDPDPLGPTDGLTDLLRDKHRVEVPVFYFPRFPSRLLRISTHVYNDLDDINRLADALRSEL